MLNRFILFGFILCSLFSCKTKVPEDVINRDKMEGLLYDYHLAQALAKTKSDSVDFCMRLYTDAVFRKYGVNEAKFNRSMEWYTRNSEELFQIYKRIDKKFGEARSANTIQGNPYASMTAVGDTMNIWTGKDFYLMSPAWNSYMSFEQAVDSTFSQGDKLMWEFETAWYYREGQKNAMAVLSLVYDNDSVSSSSQSLYSTGQQKVFISVGNRPVKLIQGFVYQVSSWSELPNILTISEPVLVKFKKKEPLKMKEVLATSDSLSSQEAKDTSNGNLNVNPRSGAVDAPSIQESSVSNQRVLRLPR